jgi:hypothetical protein
MNLFLNATHFLACCISHKHLYSHHDFNDNFSSSTTTLKFIEVPLEGHSCDEEHETGVRLSTKKGVTMLKRFSSFHWFIFITNFFAFSVHFSNHLLPLSSSANSHQHPTVPIKSFSHVSAATHTPTQRPEILQF